ncbi:MAG TPA: hypothetical protein ENK75_03495 [Saprospiraceae bacterium]|nr:hypothetical protein [Saprospiraceae bacterium]
MRTEEECKPAQRFLFSDEILSEQAIIELKNEVIRRFEKREKDNHYDKFINWSKKENEVLIFTLYAYADFDAPKTFDCLFDLNNPNDYIKVNCKMTQSLYEGFYPTGMIDDGHKHMCVFEFENGIPEIVKKLHIAKGLKYDVPKNSFQLGICNTADFDAIKEYRQNYLSLREKYGSKWWKYDKTE